MIARSQQIDTMSVVNQLGMFNSNLDAFLSTEDDPRELALAAVELEDLLAISRSYVEELKRRAIVLNSEGLAA